ncbi:histidine phosphatase superfamily protein [Tanacetum coccineum]
MYPVGDVKNLSELLDAYGDLQGLNKQETAWPRSYVVQLPNGESLEICLKRVVDQLMVGKHAMVVAHVNSLSSIIISCSAQLITFKTRYYMKGVGLESESGGRTTRERTFEVRHLHVIRDNVKEADVEKWSKSLEQRVDVMGL